MSSFFVGKKLHWLMIAAVIALLYWFGATQLHRVDYNGFLFALLGIAAGCVVIVLATYRKGDRVTREPLDSQD